jgi:hypothetical protein
MTARALSLAIPLSLVLTWSTHAGAADLAALAGSESDFRGQSYSYVGADLTHRLTPHVGVAVRVMPFYLTYRFRSGDDLVSARALGVNGLVGIKLFLGETTLGLLGGAQFRDTDLSPDVRTGGARGDQISGLAQLELDSWLPTRTNLNFFSSYSGVDDFLYTRGGVKQQLTNRDFSKPITINAGVEGFFGRNADYDSRGAGLVFELYHIPTRMAVGVRAGYKHDSTFGNGGYAGLSIYKQF